MTVILYEFGPKYHWHVKKLKRKKNISYDKFVKMANRYYKKYGNSIQYGLSIDTDDKDEIQIFSDKYNLEIDINDHVGIYMEFTLALMPIFATSEAKEGKEDLFIDFHQDLIQSLEAGEIVFDIRSGNYYVYNAADCAKKYAIGGFLFNVKDNDLGFNTSCLYLRRASKQEIEQFKLDEFSKIVLTSTNTYEEYWDMIEPYADIIPHTDF